MSYKGFSIHTINFPPGWWHAHIEKDGAGFSTLPSSRKFEWEAYGDAERKVDEVIASAESVDESMEEMFNV